MATSKDGIQEGQGVPEIRRPSVLLDVAKIKDNIAQLNENVSGE